LMDAGVRGVITRDTNPRLIVGAFEIVLLGSHYVPPAALSLAPPLDKPPRGMESPALPVRRTRISSGLSPRQEQIMRCVHMGSTNKMIARTLGISEGTVKIHLTSIFQQLGAPNRAAAVALYNGWLTGQLEVLRNSQHSTPKPVMGQPGIVPLRRPRDAFPYPLPGTAVAEGTAMAAEIPAQYGARGNSDTG
jgi:DNA-binding CsgD family transcriptional regulator